MVAMKDADLSGRLGFSDFQALASDLLLCKVLGRIDLKYKEIVIMIKKMKNFNTKIALFFY